MKECSKKKIEKICKNKNILFYDWFFAWFKLVVYYWANYFSFRRELAMPEKKKKKILKKILIFLQNTFFSTFHLNIDKIN